MESILTSLKLSHSTQQQTLLFSATLPKWVKEMAKNYFNNPSIIDLIAGIGKGTPNQVVHQYIPISLYTQRIIVLSRLIARFRKEKILVFVDTKSDCAQLAASPLISFCLLIFLVFFNCDYLLFLF